jgi:hypothetical protein
MLIPPREAGRDKRDNSLHVMPGLVPGIHAFIAAKQGVDGRDIRAFTPVFDGLCPAMTAAGRSWKIILDVK